SGSALDRAGMAGRRAVGTQVVVHAVVAVRDQLAAVDGADADRVARHAVVVEQHGHARPICADAGAGIVHRRGALDQDQRRRPPLAARWRPAWRARLSSSSSMVAPAPFALMPVPALFTDVVRSTRIKAGARPGAVKAWMPSPALPDTTLSRMISWMPLPVAM